MNMTRKIKRRLVNICAVIFMANVISVPVIALYINNLELLRYLSIGTMALVPFLLLFVSICKEAKQKGSYTNSENYIPECNLSNKIPCNIRNWVYASFHKIVKVFDSGYISPQISQPHKATDNHSLHAGSLPQVKGGKQPKANNTTSKIINLPIFSKPLSLCFNYSYND